MPDLLGWIIGLTSIATIIALVVYCPELEKRP